MALGAALGSAAIGAASSNKAAKSQQAAASAQLALQERVYEETTDRFAPFLNDGVDYQNALRFEMLGGDRPMFGGDPLDVVEFSETTETPNSQYNAVSPWWGGGMAGEGHTPTITNTRTRYRVGDQIFDDRGAADDYAKANPTGGFEYQGHQKTPGYQFAMDQGQAAIDASAASRGGLMSGATLKAQQKFGTGLANQEYNNYLNRLSAGAASGQAAAGNMASAGANYAAMGSNALASSGNAQAAGAIGVGNALQGGLNNVVGLWNYQNNQNALAPTSSIRPQARTW